MQQREDNRIIHRLLLDALLQRRLAIDCLSHHLIPQTLRNYNESQQSFRERVISTEIGSPMVFYISNDGLYDEGTWPCLQASRTNAAFKVYTQSVAKRSAHGLSTPVKIPSK